MVTEFNRNPSHVKRSVAAEPMVITRHRRPAYVVLSAVDCDGLTDMPSNLADFVEMDEDGDLDIEALDAGLRPVDGS